MPPAIARLGAATLLLLLLGGCRCRATTPPEPDLAYFAVTEPAGPQIWRWTRDAGARPLTQGPALHVPLAADVRRVLVARVLPAQEQEQLGWLDPTDGGFQALTPPLSRARRPSWQANAVAYESGAAGLSNVALTGESAGLLTDSPLGDFEPQLAPDGGFVVFVSSRTGDPELYVQCVACDAGPLRLTDDPHEDTSPALSPDGRRVAFLSNRDGVDQPYLVELGSGRTERLSVKGAATPRWSPDGKTLYFTQVDGPESTHVAAIQLAPRQEWSVSEPGARDTLDSVSTDGTWLGTTRALPVGSEVALQAIDGGRRLRVSPPDVKEAWGLVLPSGS